MKPTYEFRPGKRLPKEASAPVVQKVGPAASVVRKAAVPSEAEVKLAKLKTEAAERSRRYRERVQEKLARLRSLEGGS